MSEDAQDETPPTDVPTDIALIDTTELPTYPTVDKLIAEIEAEKRWRRKHWLRRFTQRTLRLYWHGHCYGRADYGVANARAGRFHLNFNRPYIANGYEEERWERRKHWCPEIGCEWNLAPRGLHNTHSIGIRFEAYGDHDWTAHVELFDISFYLFGKGWYPRRVAKWLAREPAKRARSYCDERETSLRWFEGSIWWSLHWPTMSWNRGDPKWRHGSWNPMDAIFGKPKYQSVLRRESAHETVDLPEYSYPCLIKISDNYWTRPRAPHFERKVTRAEVEFTEYAPPHAGKGENSWDCDDDATYSLSFAMVPDVRDEIAWAREAARGIIMETRKKYGERDNWNYQAFPVKRLPADRPKRLLQHEMRLIPMPEPPYLVSNGDN